MIDLAYELNHGGLLIDRTRDGRISIERPGPPGRGWFAGIGHGYAAFILIGLALIFICGGLVVVLTSRSAGTLAIVVVSPSLVCVAAALMLARSTRRGWQLELTDAGDLHFIDGAIADGSGFSIRRGDVRRTVRRHNAVLVHVFDDWPQVVWCPTVVGAELLLNFAACWLAGRPLREVATTPDPSLRSG